MRKNRLKKLWLWGILFFIVGIQICASEYTMEDLEFLKSQELITQEEYQILKDELQGTEADGEVLYSININGRGRFNLFKVIRENGKDYFPMFTFFQAIRFNNYEAEKNQVNIKLGKELDGIEINFNKNTVEIEKNRETIDFTDKEIFTKNSEIYIEANLFKKMFLNSLEIDDKKYSMRMNLNFTAPFEINSILENSLDRQASFEGGKELLFTNTNKFFDLGYMRFNIQNEFSKEKGKSFKSNWIGDLEYQGNFLYGEFNTSYDVKENEIGDTYFYYPEIYKGHSLEFGSYGTEERELGLSIKKEKGYFLQGKEIVIRENVPIGSKVELLYLGFPIAVETSQNGIVEFRNSEIKSDRLYTLRVYTPEGKIYNIEINTAVDFRQQNVGEIEYDFRIRENHESKKYSSEGNIYYGVTERLTLGLGYIREIEQKDDERTGYQDLYNGEIVYSNYIFRAPYTVVGGTEYGENSRTRKYLEAQLDVKNFTFRTELDRYGIYYDEKNSRTYTVEYNSENGYTIDTNYYLNDYHTDKREKDYDVGISIYRNVMKDLLITGEYSKRKTSGDEYGVNLYYTGFHSVNTRLNNRWKEDGKDYEAVLTLMNKNLWESFDFSLEFSYSNRDESKFTMRFDLDYENWLSVGMRASRGGQQSYRAGIDKVVDLKNITRNVESMDSSRVKIFTFVDSNENNIYDKGEKLVDNVEIKIGSQTQITDENGEAYFFGVPNGILYDLQPKIRKPSYSLGENKISIRGKNVGTIEAYIPIKPMVTLTGMFLVDNSLQLDELGKKEVYENTLIKVKDKDGKVLENTIPDEEGIFQVSGLFTQKYDLEIVYFGDKYKIPTLSEEVKLVHLENDENNKIVLRMNEKEIARIKSESGGV